MRAIASGRRRLLIATVAQTLAGCARSDPERELRATIEAMARAIETGRADDFLDGVTEDFTRESSAFDKRDARRWLAGLMLRDERITLAVVISDLEISGTRAQARLRVLSTGASGGLIPQRGQVLTFDTRWRREGNAWKVSNAEWRETT